MRAFLALVILFVIFMIFASSSLSHVNLVDNGTGSAQAAPAEPGGAVFGVPLTSQPTASAPQVITIQQSPAANRNLVPVTGSCTDPYTVQAGDSLSQIAVVCSTTVAAIRQANPQITDANLIYPGQQLHIPGAAAVQPVPVTGSDNGSNALVPQAAPVQPTPTIVVPVTGLYPRIAANTGLQVKGIGYPASTPVNIEIGPQGQGYTVVANGVTDANGNITTNITVPVSADPNALWVVLVTTTGAQPVQATSQPFTIGPAQ